MNQKEINDGNVLIAISLGWYKQDSAWQNNDTWDCLVDDDLLLFHMDWNALMPVYKKTIEAIKKADSGEKHVVWTLLQMGLNSYDCTECFKAVVKAIKWLNKL